MNNDIIPLKYKNTHNIYIILLSLITLIYCNICNYNLDLSFMPVMSRAVHVWGFANLTFACPVSIATLILTILSLLKVAVAMDCKFC